MRVRDEIVPVAERDIPASVSPPFRALKAQLRTTERDFWLVFNGRLRIPLEHHGESEVEELATLLVSISEALTAQRLETN